MNPSNAHTLDPAQLRPHPLKRTVPRPAAWLPGGESFNTLCDDMIERGVDLPLLVTADGFILDGEARWRAARQIGLAAVPVQVTDQDPAMLMLAALVHRRHLTKGALAYTAYPLLAPAHAEAKARRLENLRKGQCFPKTIESSSGKSPAELAASIGISHDVFHQSARLHAAFEKSDKLRDQFEPAILAGEIGLGAALAGIAGQEATLDKARKDSTQLELFSSALVATRKRFTYWAEFDEVSRERARQDVIELVAAMPEDLREEFEAAIRAAKRDGRKAA